MNSELVTDSIGFETLITEPPSTPNTHSPSFVFQPSSAGIDRVVKISLEPAKEGEQPKKKQEADRPRRVKDVWKKEEEMEYFCAVLIFSYSNPYLTLSWEWWKPKRFYNFLQEHMKSVFGVTKFRSNLQCKTKDQNFKIQHYEKSGHQVDLIDLALERLSSYVNQAKRSNKDIEFLPSSHRIHRFQDALKKYKEFVAGLSTPLPFEIELQKLMDFNKSLRKETKLL